MNYKPKHKHLVFTSAGDNTYFYKYWCEKNRNYDLFLVYYGEDDKLFNLYKTKVDIAFKRKGFKYPNFKYFYNIYKKLILQYDYVFLIDDDILISTKNMNKMFSIAKKYNLWVCQPSFDKSGKNAHTINIHKPGNLLRFTNFVEEGVPLFSKEALTNFMKEYTRPVYNNMFFKLYSSK